MVNEIATLLANHGAPGLWYIDPSFHGVNIPTSIKWVYDIVVGDDPDNTVPQLMTVLNHVDTEQYKDVFDTRELFDNPSSASIYDLYKNHGLDPGNTLTRLLETRKPLYTLFSGDEYLSDLWKLFTTTNEGVVKVCAVILALAYRLRVVWKSYTPALKAPKPSALKQNTWVEEPNLSANTWKLYSGDQGILTMGASQYGAVMYTPSWCTPGNWEESGYALPKAVGSYSLRCYVNESSTYTGLTKTLFFTITEPAQATEFTIDRTNLGSAQTFELNFVKDASTQYGEAYIDWGEDGVAIETVDVMANWNSGQSRKVTHKYTSNQSEAHIKLYGNFCAFTVGSGDVFETSNPSRNAVASILSWGDNITRTTLDNMLNTGTFLACVNASGAIPEWGANIVDATLCYALCLQLSQGYDLPAWGAKITKCTGCYIWSTSYSEIPAWTDAMEVANSCYLNSNVTGSPPAWGANITDVTRCYNSCNNIVGPLPTWGASIVIVDGCYEHCSGIGTTVPAWTNTIESAEYCYSNSGVTGAPPEWGANMSNVRDCYAYCYDLYGSIPEWGESIENAESCYMQAGIHGTNGGLTGPIPDWSDAMSDVSFCYMDTYITGSVPSDWKNIINADQCFYGCKGLTGDIPAWGDSLYSVASCYGNCTGLEDTSAELDLDPTPDHIREHSNAVQGCNATIRAKFPASWGGTGS